MTIKIEPIGIPAPSFYEGKTIKSYLVKYRWHWWQRWRYVMDGYRHTPRIFVSKEEIVRHFFEIGFYPKE